VKSETEANPSGNDATAARPRRRWLRWLGRLTAWGIGVLVVIIALSVKPVDRTPYFTTGYYDTTKDDFVTRSAAYKPVTGALRAGFGKAKLSPVLGAAVDDPEHGQFKALPMAGYNERKSKPATDVHDELWVKAVAMEVEGKRLVMLSLDALIVPPDVSKHVLAQLAAKYSLGQDEVYFSATHTHSGIGGWGKDRVSWAFAGDYQPGVAVWFEHQLVAAVDDAMSRMAPASIGGGRFSEPKFVRNRLAKDRGRVDNEFSYLMLHHEDGSSAVIGVYNAHATVLPNEVMELSADYPGYWERQVEKSTGGMAMYLAGAVGSHGPAYGYRSFEGAQEMGEGLAKEVLDRLPDTKLSPTTTLGALGLDLALPESQVRVLDTWRLRPTVTGALIPVENHTHLQAVRLGDMLWFSTPCDFSGELAMDLKAPLELRGYHATITSFNGDYIGYVVPQHYYDYTKYESRAMSFYGPYVSPLMVDWMRRMADVVAPVTK